MHTHDVYIIPVEHKRKQIMLFLKNMIVVVNQMLLASNPKRVLVLLFGAVWQKKKKKKIVESSRVRLGFFPLMLAFVITIQLGCHLNWPNRSLAPCPS